VARVGAELFGEKFVPLCEFMPFINYTELLAEIDIAMFNEAREREITVLDRLGLHSEPVPERVGNAQSRSPNKFRPQLAYWLFIPDPTIVGARAVARHEKVIAAVRGASFILSSSPPPSQLMWGRGCYLRKQV
jgi:hypothetical protein